VETHLAALLAELEQFGNAHDEGAVNRKERMLNITPDTGEFLTVLVRATRATQVLEIGTSNGYSTLWLVHAVQPLNGHITTLEIAPQKAAMARANFARAGFEAWITSQVTDAGEFLKREPDARWGLIFLDAERVHYSGYWLDLQRVLKPCGLLVVDNAVSHPREVADFVAMVKQTAGYTTSLVPVGKGEFMAFKEP
jgi:predicted O-methyltransferase YrrM